MDTAQPLLTVIIPIYNAAPYIRQCLDSVCNQTYRNLEIICVNDGSTDASGEILEEYAHKDSRIICITQENAGQAVARNKALDRATGEWVANVDSDDYLEPFAYEHVARHFEDAINMVWIGFHIVGEGDEKLFAARRRHYQFKEFGKVNIHQIPIVERSQALCNKVIRRSIIEQYQVRYPEGYIFEDSCFWGCISPFMGDVYMLDEPLYFYRQRPNSTLGKVRTKSSEKAKDALRIIEPLHHFYQKHGLLDTPDKETYTALFINFFNLAVTFCPEKYKIELIREAYRYVEAFGVGSKKEKKNLLAKITKRLCDTPLLKLKRVLGLRLA